MVALIPSPVKFLHETRIRTEGMDAGMTQAGLQKSKGFKTANGDIVRKARVINASHDSMGEETKSLGDLTWNTQAETTEEGALNYQGET